MVTFETKCYEKDWKLLLTTPYLQRQIERCNTNFSYKQLIINNVVDELKVRKYADKAISKGIIDSYYCVSQYKDTVLEYFNTPYESFNGGYNYSISELTGLYCCKTPYLLHFASDTILEINQSSWITDAINCMNARNEISVANPVWNHKYIDAENDATYSDNTWFYSQGFSDQCYLVRTAEFAQQIYNYTHPISQRYPLYGGELFEKRVDAYMRSLDKIRITSKNVSYIHKNIPKNKLKRFFYILNWKYK